MNQENDREQTLAQMITEGSGLPLGLVLDIAQQVGEYLRSLYNQERVHGAISPANIVFDQDGQVQVLDPEENSLEEIEPHYHAPEIRTGEEPSPQSDFYSLGAVLYQALTGELPEPDVQDPWPGNKRPGLPPELDELVAKCLQTEPSKRIQSAVELLNGVEEVHRGMKAGADDTILGMEDALIGHTLGAYQLVERLGQGGMATVYKAYEPNLDRYVAIKVLPQFFARDPNFMQRFRREAKAVAQLKHPNIMPIYNYGEEGEITYIVMQHVEGGTLKQARGQVYEPEEAVRLAIPIVRALAYAHRRGIVHRDIKPSNVLLGEDDWPMLADFGLAKMAEASQKLTGTGVGIGTPMYMSPEQGHGTDVDQRTDIYSMGIMLYEMLTGDVPFRADTPMAVVIKHMTAPLPMPRTLNPDIPEILEHIVLKATAKEPANRYQTAEEMVVSLERASSELEAMSKVPPEISVAAPKVIPPRIQSTVQKHPKKKSKTKNFLKIGVIGISIIVCLVLAGGLIFGAIKKAQDLFATTATSVVSDSMSTTSVPQTEEAITLTVSPEASSIPENALGAEYRSEDGGYAFLTIPTYLVEGLAGGGTYMYAPNADPDYGPAIIFDSEIAAADITVDQLYEEYKQLFTEDSQPQFTNKRTITVGGLSGVAADLSGDLEGQEIVGRFVVVKLTPIRDFTIIAAAPGEQWNELDPLYDAVLDSITFFEPTSSVEVAPESATSQPTPTQPPVEEAYFEQDGIKLYYDPQLVLDVNPPTESIPASSGGGMYDAAHPAYLHFDLSMEQAQVYVAPVREYEAVADFAPGIIADLQRLNEGMINFDGCVPELPLNEFFHVCDHQQFNANASRINFQNGSGVRFLTVYGIQDLAPVDNQNLVYIFQGLTNDGKYYLKAIVRLSHTQLPDVGEIPADVYAATDASVVGKYFDDFELLLNQNEADFQPKLDWIDAFLKSLRVE
ncbi:MAG: protein kinase [Chloroflexota bacterium]|nr:protein kinase [Chloroflexota bacterium]